MREFLEAFKKKFLCCHEWEEFKQSKIFWSAEDKLPMYIEITLICKKCGKIKKIKA